MTGSRLAPGAPSLLARVVARGAQRVMRTAHPPNLFVTLGRHPSVFRGWLFFAGRLMPGGKLPRRDTELVILRVAHLRSCEYEWDHHVELGRRVGVDASDVQEGPGFAGWSPRQRALLEAVDELHGSGDLSDPTWTALHAHLGDRLMVEFVMLVGHYEMLATAIAALRIQTDRSR